MGSEFAQQLSVDIRSGSNLKGFIVKKNKKKISVVFEI
jgi:hypothetical protein